MYAMGRIGSYISRGVSNVSSPFHPFGGAVDIIVVEQPDGSFKTSPWYVQFGKFQGVLKAKEKTLSINVNGADADFYMYLDNNGEAYFVREVYEQEGPPESDVPSLLGHDTDWENNKNGQMFKKSKSFSFMSRRGKTASESGSPDKKVRKIFGLLVKSDFGKEDSFCRSALSTEDRKAYLERAEMAARLLEVKWSTNLATTRSKKCDTSMVCNLNLEDRGQRYALKDDTQDRKGCPLDEDQIPTSSIPETCMDPFTLEETYLELKLAPDISKPANQADSSGTNGTEEPEDLDTGNAQGMSDRDSFVLHSLALKSDKNEFSSSGEQCNILEIMEAASEINAGQFHSYMCCQTSQRFTEQVLDGSYREEKVCGPVQSNFFPVAQRYNVDSELQYTVAGCEMDRRIDRLDSNDCCNFLDESHGIMGRNGYASSIAAVTVSNDVGSNLITEVDTSKQKESFNQKLNITDTSIFEERIDPGSHAQEDTLGDCCAPLSSSSCSPREDNKDDRFYEVAFIGPATGFGSSIIPEVEHFLMDGLSLPEHQKNQLVESIAVHSTRQELQIQDWSGSREIKFDDTDDIAEGSEFVRDSSKQEGPNQLEVPQTLSIPSGMGRAHNDVDDRELTAQSIPSLQSNEDEVNVPGINHFRSHSEDLNSGFLMLMHSDIPASIEKETVAKQQSTSESAPLEDLSITEEIKKILSEPAVELSLCGHLLSEGMGYEAASSAFDAEKLDVGKLTYTGPDLVKDSRLIVRIGGLYFPWDAAVHIVSMIGSSEQILQPKGMIAIDKTERSSKGNAEQSIDPKRSKWKLWSSSINKSNNSMMGGIQSMSLGAGDSTEGLLKETDITQKTASPKKKVIKTKTPTSEQLASLNLKEGKNTVTFTFSTPMLGEQKVDARIFLWKWNARIVISDVDGTITKSDVLGQFMPLMGYDWSQTGVAHLFSAIKENGYELLFLSARAISQAYHTRQFLINLKQDGKTLPEGPVVISPDGLFPSLFREVIRRAPHEFKITCLEDIKSLFPPDSNPFYAGFGNRDTDEISYRKVGIPKGKIFIINPKGQVAVHRRVHTKSYSNLHSLVHDMFPSPSSTSGTEQEDYNSWNFWRLPPSDIF